MSQVGVFLRSDRRLLVAWMIGLGGFAFLIGAIYASFDDPDALNTVLENYPEELLEVFGAMEDLSGVQGFLSAELGSYFPLVLGIFAVMLMTKHLAGAEERGALDHLLSRPITRGQYYWSLVAAASVLLALLLAGAGLGAMLGFALAGVSVADLLGTFAYMMEMLPLAIAYLAVGAFAGASFHRRSQANGAGIAAVIVFFMMDVVSRLVDAAEWFEYLTPHAYLARSDLFNGDLDLAYVAFCSALAALFFIAGSMRFEAKNLYA